MGDCKRSNLDVSDNEAQARANVFHTLDFLLRAALCNHFQNFAVRCLGEVCGAIPFALHLCETTGMVAVLMGDENAVHTRRGRATERFEAPEHFPASKPGVNQESRLPGFEQCGVARTARGEDRNTKRDAALSVCCRRTKFPRSDTKDDCKLAKHRQQDDSKSKLRGSELEAVEVPDNGSGKPVGLKEFARELLNILGSDFLK